MLASSQPSLSETLLPAQSSDSKSSLSEVSSTVSLDVSSVQHIIQRLRDSKANILERIEGRQNIQFSVCEITCAVISPMILCTLIAGLYYGIDKVTDENPNPEESDSVTLGILVAGPSTSFFFWGCLKVAKYIEKKLLMANPESELIQPEDFEALSDASGMGVPINLDPDPRRADVIMRNINNSIKVLTEKAKTFVGSKLSFPFSHSAMPSGDENHSEASEFRMEHKL